MAKAADRVSTICSHSFAVQALMRWYRDGADVQSNLPGLAIYMGHVSIVSTAHYLRFVPAMASLASERFERRFRRSCRGGPDMKPRQANRSADRLVGFFQEYLPTLRGMSRHTIQSYRDGLVLFLQFAAHGLPGARSRPWTVADITADRVERFLASLETAPSQRHRHAQCPARRSPYLRRASWSPDTPST